MSTEEIRDLLAASQDLTFDETEVKDVNIEALDGNRLVEMNPGLTSGNSGGHRNIDQLIDTGVLSGEPGSYHVTVAGWLIFARDPQSVRSFRNAYIEFQQFNGTSRDTPIKKAGRRGASNKNDRQELNSTKGRY